MLARLINIDAKAFTSEIALAEFPVRRGRGDEVDVLLEDKWVSRVHCEIKQQGDALFVRDLGSRHGTFVNGKPVREAWLFPGDELNVGLTRFVASYTATSHSYQAG